MHVDAQSGEASATVANGKGSIVWANGGYYVGEIKGGKQHGEGTETFVDGGKYVGRFENGQRRAQVR